MANDSDDDLLRTGGALNVFADVAGQGDEAFLGRDLGDYRITGLIAEGGMSRVFRAERTDGSFEREVAIKISPVSSFNERMCERFVQEQGVLAGLNHPNISHLYDAQVTGEGWPYIVMELVDGGQVDEFCKENKVSVERRVRLLIEIIDAVSFAHARLIVHRDIKPSNVLVNEEGRPKLLDFGIAKLLEGDEKNLTKAGPMTPRYASPEQLLGQPITIASDVYQLGLLIAEVLTGNALNQDEAMSTAIQRAADRRPLTISAAARRGLPRELLLIVEQCLRVSPDDRYRDANALKSDLQAYLDGYPVSAAGQSAGYRLRKFIARNLPSTTIAAIAVLAIVGGGIWYTLQISAARDLAERRATTANRVLQTMSGLVADTFSGLVDSSAERNVGSESYVESVLADTVALIDRELEAEPQARAELLRVQGSIEMVLGNNARAASVLDDAYSLVDADSDPEIAVQIMLERAEVASRMREYDIARGMLDEATVLVSNDEVDDEVMAHFYHQSGQVLQAEGEFEAAGTAFERAVSILEQRATPNTRLLASTYEEIAFNYTSWEKHAEALAAAEKAIEILEAKESPISHRLINPLRFAGYSQIMTDDLSAGRASYERALSIANANFGEIHPDVAVMQDSLGALAYREGRLADAAAHFEEMIRLVTIMDGTEAPNLIVPKLNAAVIYTDLAEMDKAGQYFGDVFAATVAGRSEDQHYRYAAVVNDGRRLHAIGDFERAADRYDEAMHLAPNLFGDDSFQVVDAEKMLAISLARSGQNEQAREHFDASARKYGETWGFGEAGHQEFVASNWILDWINGDLQDARAKLTVFTADKIARDDLDVIYWSEMFGHLAAICIIQGDLTCAREALDSGQRGAKASPSHPWAYHLRVVEAEYQIAIGNIEEARSQAEAALREIEERYPLRTDDIRRARAIIDS